MIHQTVKNQLKLNLDAVVDNLNLVNLCHNPKPILIEKKSNQTAAGHARNYFGTNSIGKSSFEFVDEEKMSMYSFLVQRDLKTKEWLSKFELDNQTNLNESIVSAKSIQNVPVKNKTSNLKKPIEKKPVLIQESSAPIIKKKAITASKQAPADLNEIKKCCDDSIKSIEYLQKQLDEFKHERLKVVCNDQQEEEKQKRIQREQIKYLSRTMYTLKNQMGLFQTQFKQEINKGNEEQKLMAILTRVVHTMRQVIKTISVFADSFPYRPLNDSLTDKLCVHFYKQLNLSIDSFTECIVKLNELTHQFNHVEFESKSVVDRLSSLLLNCNHHFVDINSVDIDMQIKPVKRQESVDRKKILLISSNVVRIPGIIKKKKPVSKIKQPKPVSKNVDASPVRKLPDQDTFETKTIKTARLFPSKSNLAKTSKRVETDEPTHDASILSDSHLFSPAFKHLTSPKLSKMGYRSKSAEKLPTNINNSQSSLNSVSMTPTKLKATRKHYSDENLSRNLIELRLKEADEMEKINNLKPLNDIAKKQAQLKSTEFQSRSNQYLTETKNHVQNKFIHTIGNDFKPFEKKSKQLFEKTHDICSRLDRIQRESDMIRRKYEKLNYEETLMKKFAADEYKRPYEECYVANAAVVTQEYETKINEKNQFIALNKPTQMQLKRVLDYAKDFEEYTQRTSVTTIGESKFDDFELFEYLSNGLYEECFDSIVQELENVNDELASQLLSSEFTEYRAESFNNSSSEN